MEEYLKLIRQHDEGTGICSFQNHIRQISPTYKQIIEEGEKIVPAVLTYLRDVNGGMNIMLLLWDILKTTPYHPKQVKNDKGEVVPGFAAFNVHAAARAWINWGIEQGLITQNSTNSRFDFDANTIDGAKQYIFARAKQLLKHGYKFESMGLQEWGIIAFFSKHEKTYQALYILKDFRGKGLYKQNIHQTILTSKECQISHYLHSNKIDYVEEVLTPFEEYNLISDFYGSKKAKRSGVFYMNHIDEGLYILNRIEATMTAKKAYCIHPLIQGDEDLLQNRYLLSEVDVQTVITATEYRSVANEYLSKRKIQSADDIRLSPLKDVNDMLIADKIQNRKDFELYHKNHEHARELKEYFDNWFYKLGITEEFYQECVKVCS